jgi:hypothetical protein
MPSTIGLLAETKKNSQVKFLMLVASQQHVSSVPKRLTVGVNKNIFFNSN